MFDSLIPTFDAGLFLLLGAVLGVAAVGARSRGIMLLAVSALGTGIVAAAVQPSGAVNVALFAVFAAISFAIHRSMTHAAASGSRVAPQVFELPDPSEAGAGAPASTLVGRTAQLDAGIVLGEGIVEIDETVWRVKGPDVPAGTIVRVVRIERGCLRVAVA